MSIPLCIQMPRELAAGAARLRELVLVMREDEVEAAAVDLEAGPRSFSAIAEHSMCQPGRPRPHGESHARVLPGFVAFQSAKSRGSFFSALGSSSAASRPAVAAELPVVRVARDAEVDVAVDGVGVALVDEPLDQRDDLRHRLGDLRHVVGPAEPEAADVLDVPLARARRELGARGRARPS